MERRAYSGPGLYTSTGRYLGGSTTIDGTGWTVEMRLPSRTLHFNAGLSEWGFTFCATSRATAPCSTWSGVTIDSDVLDLSSAGLLSGARGWTRGTALTVTPYAGRFERSAAGPTERPRPGGLTCRTA